MRPLSKNEIWGTVVILLIIFTLTILNLRISLRRSRDAQRQADVNAISDALDAYQKDFGYFPPASEDGKILACKGSNFGKIPADIKDEDRKTYFFNMLRGCDWGKDILADVNDDTFTPYMKLIPLDPRTGEGYSYLYISDMNHYQMYAYLEGGRSEDGFRQGIVNRNLKCGVNFCNFGKSYGETPLEMSIEEYENELRKIK